MARCQRPVVALVKMADKKEYVCKKHLKKVIAFGKIFTDVKIDIEMLNNDGHMCSQED